MNLTANQTEILYGTAYYPEYMPVRRISTDMEMMKKAGINTIRIAESSWSSFEPSDGVFDFSIVREILDNAKAYSLHVIVGTPTYAIPSWLVRKYPDILAVTHSGPSLYGHRQNMDITHPGYLFHAERIIRRLMEVCATHPNVIGYQLDNETKSYDTAGERVQKMFVDYLKDKFKTTDALNEAFGLTYWSNRIASWEDFPDVRGTINASLGAEFKAFQRRLVTDFLSWQSGIVREYARDDQFLTQNFDFAWSDHSEGLQPEVDQRSAARALTIAGVDIYHPSAGDLTGAEIAMGGAIGRSIKKAPYLVLETQAQGNPGWLPYPGQLRLQAYSHLAGGAASVMYWHWHSIHNSFETYWKGILSHDLQENETYREVCQIGQELAAHTDLLSYHPVAECAILLGHRSLTGLSYFPIGGLSYHQIMRWLFDALYRLNIACDVIYPEDVLSEDTDILCQKYRIILTPALYSASDPLIDRLKRYVFHGGHLISTFRSFFSDESLSVHPKVQPCGLTECFGIAYDQFTVPSGIVPLRFTDGIISGDAAASQSSALAASFMELLRPLSEETEVLAAYDHSAYKKYAAVTWHPFGKGSAAYLGCFFTDSHILEELLRNLCVRMGILPPGPVFPVICRRSVNENGSSVLYLFNYSGKEKTCFLPETGSVTLAPYDVQLFYSS